MRIVNVYPEDTKRFEQVGENLYAICKDGTIKSFDGKTWSDIPSAQIKCPHCNKLLEPHVCKED